MSGGVWLCANCALKPVPRETSFKRILGTDFNPLLDTTNSFICILLEFFFKDLSKIDPKALIHWLLGWDFPDPLDMCELALHCQGVSVVMPRRVTGPTEFLGGTTRSGVAGALLCTGMAVSLARVRAGLCNIGLGKSPGARPTEWFAETCMGSHST